MNCDQVFAILTRGPFPTGARSDHAVEAHLSHCDDCRSFAGALRPDNSMDAEAMVAEESSGLPYYWGLAAAKGEQAVSCALPEGRSRTRRTRRKSLFKRAKPAAHQLSTSQLVFAVIMGATLGLLLRYIDVADTRPQAPAVATVDPDSRIVASRMLTPVDVHDQLRAKLGATPACVERRMPRIISESESAYDDRPLVVQTAARGAQCCTDCHNAQSPRLALSATTAKIVRSCQICHVEPSQSGIR